MLLSLFILGGIWAAHGHCEQLYLAIHSCWASRQVCNLAVVDSAMISSGLPASLWYVDLESFRHIPGVV